MIGNKVFLFVVLVLILSSCTTYQVDAAIYKWTDSKGEVNHAPMPPGGVAFSTLVPVASTLSAETILSKNTHDTLLIQQYNCQEAKQLQHALEQSEENHNKDKSVNSLVEKAQNDIYKYCQ